MVTDENEYYFPDIIKDVVERVNEFFENRVDDPFSIRYDHGPYAQVGNDRLKEDSEEGEESTTGLPFVWLVMPFTETDAKDESYCSDVTCRFIIGVDSEPNISMEQREQDKIFPFLIPIKRKLKELLSQEPRLDNSMKVQSSNRILPFWGGSDPAGESVPNLWKKNYDCIDLFDVKLKKENKKDCTPFTNM